MMNMKKLFLMTMLLMAALTACDREDSHVVVVNNPDQSQGGAIVGFNTEEVTGTKFADTHFYGFDNTGKMILHSYYATQQELASELFQLEAGAYTFVAVLNVGKDYVPTVPSRADAPLLELTLNQLMTYVKQSEPSHPDMLTGMITRTIALSEVVRLEIPLHDKAGALPLTACKVTTTLTLPDAAFGEYQSARVRATEPYNLRGVVAYYLPGKEECVLRQAAVLTATATAGVYTMETEVEQGNYELLVWVDYTESGSVDDLYYNTESLKAIHFLATDRQYITGTDRREVFYGKSTVKAEGEQAATSIALERPLAKYCLVADDIDRYRSLMKTNPEKYPELSELTITILYEGYLPCGFNVSEGKPNHSETGYKYQNALPAIGAADKTVQVASDYVMVNGTESSVTVTVLVTDRTGRKISQVKGIEVKYKRGMVTTIKGEFLAAGVVNPGINIDTDWENTHEVTF